MLNPDTKRFVQQTINKHPRDPQHVCSATKIARFHANNVYYATRFGSANWTELVVASRSTVSHFLNRFHFSQKDYCRKHQHIHHQQQQQQQRCHYLDRYVLCSRGSLCAVCTGFVAMPVDAQICHFFYYARQATGQNQNRV